MIMRRIESNVRRGDAKVWSYPGMEKVVQQLRKKIDGVSELFTLNVCRHGGMTELEEAELTDGQGRALSGHKTAQAYRGYAKETISGRWRRPESGMHICWRRSNSNNRMLTQPWHRATKQAMTTRCAGQPQRRKLASDRNDSTSLSVRCAASHRRRCLVSLPSEC